MSRSLTLLVVGSGGREHAIADGLHREMPLARLLVAPGNPGTGGIGTNVPVEATDVGGLVDLAAREVVDLVVVGPEQPLAAGLVDALEEVGRPVFGPSKAAARLESSKAFAKDLMASADVPTARHRTFRQGELAVALAYLEELPEAPVVKASGLAGGKGAIVCDEKPEAEEALREMLVEGRFGEAGQRVVVEERLRGEELSVFYVSDGERPVFLAASRDHKRLEEGDRGPNTGGMGAYSPVADATPELLERVEREIARPVVEAMAERGTPYRGFLYAGLMLTPEGPKVLEFNCRLGDPEAQVVLPLVASDLAEPLRAVAAGEEVGGWRPALRPGAALVTVLASGGYPRAYETGKAIRVPPGLEGDELRIYHAGTGLRDDRLVTDGGRVLGVTGLGESLEEAAARSREGAEEVDFDGKTWRRDIGRAELEVG